MAEHPEAVVQALFEELSAGGPMVGILLCADEDRAPMAEAVEELTRRGISHEVRVLPVHRDPRGVAEYASIAVLRGLRVLICSASNGANLPAAVASYTELPVIGVPIRGESLAGLDTLLATVQAADGVPVGCMALNGARNAAVFAAKILAQGLGGTVKEL